MNERKNNRSTLMAMITIALSLILMNLGHLDGAIPDGVIRLVGVVVMIATGVSIFFTVRSLMEEKESKNNSNKE